MNFKAHKTQTKRITSFGSAFVVFVCLFFSETNFAQITKRESPVAIVLNNKQLSNFSLKDTLSINNLINLAREYRYRNTDSLLILSRYSLELSKNVNFKNGQIESYRNIGNFYSDNGKTSEAISNFNKAFKLADEHNVHLKVKTMNDLSNEYSYQGDYANALKGYLDAIEIAKSIDFKSLLSILNENIAQLYLQQKDYDHAMVFFKKVKLINEQIGNPIYRAETMSNIAFAYVEMNELEYAMFNVNSSIPIFEKEKVIPWLAYCYDIKGKIYLKQEKYDWAQYWYKQSEMLHTEINDDRGKISLLNGMSEAYIHLENDSLADVYAIEALNLSKKLNFKQGTKKAAELLYTINKRKNNYETALSFHEIFQATSDSLSQNDNEKALNMLKTKTEYDLQKKQLVLDNEKALAKQQTYIYVFIIILVILSVAVFIIRRDGRIQKKLNAELLSKKTALEDKQKYLNELNQTKNKLFSIIGHDLRGPIGAFQGLLKMFKEGEMTKDEFLDFVPKLKVDIDTISFTLNNLLSWGQTQMKGSITTPTITNLDAIIQENIALLSETAEAKSIDIVNRVEPNCQIWSDPNQIDIIIRNLLSNALKFTPNKGQIIIGAIQKLKRCEIYIKDNGIGMSEETVAQLFQNEANQTTYGTNNEKGTGLGLSLCKEMVEKNGGKIWVHSALGSGSSFYFTIPRVTEQFKKSA